MDPEFEAWSVVPHQPNGQVPVTPELRDEFAGHLSRLLRSPGDAPPEATSAANPPPRPEEDASFGIACSACRGWCCRKGGAHAHLAVATLTRVAVDRPDLGPEAVRDLYLSRLGDTHVAGSCVFHGPEGCRLPRDLRSDTCNDWLCPDLRTLRHVWRGQDGPPARHAYVAIRAGTTRVSEVRVMVADGSRPGPA